MFCRNCGKELPDSAKFCSGCGTPVAPAASQPASAGEEAVRETAAENMAAGEIPEPPVEETPAENTPETSVMEAPTVFFQPTAPAAVDTPVTADTPVAEEIPVPVQKRRGKADIAVIGLGAIAAVVVVVVLFKLFSGMAGGSTRTPAFAYLTDDNELMYLANLKEKTEAIEVSDEVDAGKGAMGIVAMDNVKFSSDGKTIYFLNEQDSLYKISVSDLKKDERPERIAREVISFSVLDSGYVLYQKKGISIDIVRYFELNCYDGKNSFRISKGYNDYQLSQDQKTVYYADPNKNDRTLTLYKRALKENADPEELLSGATDIYTDFDADILVYSEDKRDSEMSSVDADQNTLTVYSCKPGGEPTELVSGICSIYSVDVDGGNVSFYYDRDERQEYKLYDLVSDAQQSADAAITAQDLVWPDWYGTYYPDEVYEQNGAAYYRTSLGASFPIDTSALQASTGLTVAELVDYYGIFDLAYADAQERYNADVEEYNNKYEEWNAANNRNQMRESLKNESYTQHTRDIYHYTGSADAAPIITSIDENQFAASYEDGIFIYKKTAGIAGGKACDLADLNYYGEIYDRLNSGSGGGEWYQNVGGVESVLDLDEESSVNGVIVLNGTEAVLHLSEDGDAWLDAYTMGDTALTFSNTVVDDEFASPRKAQDTKGSDVLYFFTNVEEEDDGKWGDFNRYSSGKTEVVAKEVYGVYILDDSGTMYAITDRDSKCDELSLVKEDKLVTVSDEIDSNVLVFLDSKQVLYIANNDLYLWNGKEERRIAKDVEYVWANTKERYIPYGPYGPFQDTSMTLRK